jgi:hypothetical protein
MVRAQRVLIRLTPIGAHLSRIRFFRGLICRWLSPPFGGNSQGIPPLGYSYPVVARRAIVHVHECALHVQTRARRGRVDEWTAASGDGRVRRGSGRPGCAAQRSHGSDPHTGMGHGRSVSLRRPWGVLECSPASVTDGFYENAVRSGRGTASTPCQGNTFVISPQRGTCRTWQLRFPAGRVKSHEYSDSMGGISRAEQRCHDRYRCHG